MAFMAKIRNSRLFQQLLRVLQFLSSLISLAAFSSRLVKIARLGQQATRSNGAVEGILAAAVAYTLMTMLVKFFLRNGGPKFLRWVFIALDVLFVGAFIAVADLTRPNGGPSGPCRSTRLAPIIPKGQNCNLPWATFILAIISTVLHAITAIFHEVKDHHNNKKQAEHDKEMGLNNGDSTNSQSGPMNNHQGRQ